MNKTNICKAAFVQADITPDFPVELIGCYRADSKADGVLHKLYAQVLLFELGGERHCLIAVDSLGLTTALSQELRGLVAGELGGGTSHVMLNFSHTHSAPAPLSALNGQRYFKLLCGKVTGCVKKALGKLQPCLAGWAVGKTQIAENRRDGCSIVDERLGALQVVSAKEKKPIALLLRVSAHANVLMTGSNGISSDYFGVAREKISNHLGCPVMMMQGAAGNLKPTGVDKIVGGTVRDVERISDVLLQEATSLRFEPENVVYMAMLEKEIELCSDVPLAEEAERIAAEAGINAIGWLAECERLRAAGITGQAERESVQFFFLNEGCLCGVPDEIFCEIALEAASRANAPLLFLNGYTNGCTGYLPHREEWVKGGYETLYSYLEYYKFHGRVLPFRAETAEQIVDVVVDAWEENCWRHKAGV